MNNSWKLYWQLSIAMIRTGILGYGGGPSVIPLIRYEAVTRYRWMEDDEFGETLAIANALPGPIATKMAAYIGYKLKGNVGAVLAVITHILPSCIAMIALLSVVSVLSTSKVVAGMIAGVAPVVAVMLGVMAYEFAKKTIDGLGKVMGISMFLLAFLLLETVHIHPAIVIILFLAYGSIHFRTAAKWKKEHKNKESEKA
ncbi:chromate transporter [Bacillus smithii]|uniref:chromate transporter n=1 Tax=Bacillus smithii TaxID=1479 RepID=UPI000671C872|nr:chromate transporter [Bacillus smithii]AKP48182.1 Chromate transport protein [Bacillus smithii]MED0660443.1 chromate transporter [Bacillus smithii]